MPDFLVSAATGVLSPVLGKLAALLSDEYKRFKGVRGEVKFLIRELEAMHAFLLKKSEEENPDAQDKVWMKEVRELSYDIEDSLDDFKVRVDDDSASAKPDGFIDKCKKLLEKTKARRRIAKSIQDLKVQVKEVSERNQRYNICEAVTNTSKVTIDPRALAIFEDASKLMGIDQPKQEVISFLKDDGCISSQPKIVSIVGIGGIGKTTLANRVYQELEEEFQCRAFLSVSRNPDMVNILRTILSLVTGQRYCETEAGNIQQLIMEISEFLRTRRYIIVVDNVWDVETWDTIKYALSSNSCGSVIITTTRIHDVAKACCSLYPDGWVYKAEPLEEQDSKMLFHNRIFGPGNECPENLIEVSDKILKKCGGLPLAIIAISGLLVNKAWNGVHSVTEWDQVQTSLGHGLERNSTVEGMMRILSLSYFDLPYHLKACLLYLSIFPEDYEIDKMFLVRLWAAEGFIPAKSTCTLQESGEKSFNELINRNLILPCTINKLSQKIDGCRVHDTVLDFIVCKSIEDNFVTVHGIPRLTPAPPGIKVRRLSLQGETEADVPLNQNYANVRSVISFGSPFSLLGFRFLRVLALTETLFGTNLANHHLANIGELLNLRYLGLYCTGITELPEEIGALQYLETLHMGSFIRQLPTAIVRLKSLVNLTMGGVELDSFPSLLKHMQALEELMSLRIDIEAASILEEIGDLTNIRHLEILFDSDSCTIDKESYVDLLKKMVSSFQRLNKLQTLDVRFPHSYEAVILDGDDVIIEVPWCSASLRKLVFKMSPMSRVPSWMKSLVSIEELDMQIKKLDQESLCILGDLPVLVDLILLIVSNVEGIHSTDKQRLVVSNRHGYRSLRHFYIRVPTGSRTSSPMLTFEAGSMPMLEELLIDFDADITISVSNGCLDFGLKHLSKLTKVKCNMVGIKLNILRVEAAIQKALDNHPKLPSFIGRHFSSNEGEMNNRERLRPRKRFFLRERPRRRRQSTVHTRQPKPPSVVCTSGSDVRMSFSTTDDNNGQMLTAALQLPMDLSFAIHHHGTSTEPGRRHGQRRNRSEARQVAIRGRELVQGAPVIPDHVKGTSGAAPATSAVLGPQLIAAPQQQEAFAPPCFTFGSGSHLKAVDLANAITSTFNRISLCDEHPGSSATVIKAASSDTGAVPATSDVLKPLVAAPQQ